MIAPRMRNAPRHEYVSRRKFIRGGKINPPTPEPAAATPTNSENDVSQIKVWLEATLSVHISMQATCR